jgi:hypothetical protein
LFEGLEKRVKKNNRGGETISYWKDGVMVYKSCNKCREIKKVEEFSKDKSKAYELSIRCKVCDSEKCKKWNKKNKEHVKECNTKYYQEHKEYFKDWSKKQNEKLKAERESNPAYIEKKRKQEEERIEKARIKAEEAEEKARLREIAKANRVKTPLEIAAAKERERIENRKRYQLNKEKEKEKRDQKNAIERKRAINLMEKFDPLIKELNLNAYGYIYLFTNIKTGHHYVGQTKLPLDVRYQKEIIKAWIKDRKKFKSQKFKEELIEENFKVTEMLAVGCCQYHLDKLEVYFIDKYDSYNNGYNNQDGNYRTNDGIEEFKQILEENNLQFIDDRLTRK